MVQTCPLPKRLNAPVNSPIMHLKCHKRFKDGKEHRYWSITEKYRGASGRFVDRHVLYLGEINDSQKQFTGIP
jgi:hypothetical protein